MKAEISILIAISRQVEGERIFLKVIDANEDREVLDNILLNNTLPRTEVMQEMDCIIEYGVIDHIEVEISDNK